MVAPIGARDAYLHVDMRGPHDKLLFTQHLIAYPFMARASITGSFLVGACLVPAMLLLMHSQGV